VLYRTLAFSLEERSPLVLDWRRLHVRIKA
jgi:hypothetical protein